MSLRHKQQYVDQPTAADIERRIHRVDEATHEEIREVGEKKMRWVRKLDSDRPTLHVVVLLLAFFILLRLLMTFGSVNVVRSAKTKVNEEVSKTIESTDSWLSTTWKQWTEPTPEEKRAATRRF